MTTPRQKKLAKAIVENLKKEVPQPAGALLESAGYGLGTQLGSPGRTIEQKGVQEELIRLGFSEGNAKKVVARLMNDEDVDPNARLKAADMTFKVHGSYAPERSVNMNLNLDMKQDPKSLELAKEYEDKLKEQLQG
jgi:hypothetical protein